MPEGIIKNRVGKTPLIRAEKLEKELGIKKIFLKLEGNNPSGHREDRLADLLIRDAISVGKKTICLGTFDKLGKSIAYLSQYYEVNCIFVLPKNSKSTRNKILHSPNVKVIELDKCLKSCAHHSLELSEANGWYNANPGMENNILNMTALSYISSELVGQVKDEIHTVFALMSYGFSISGLHLGFRQLWVEDKINKLPMLYSCTTNRGNVIYESYKQKSPKILAMPKDNIKVSKYNKHLVNTESSLAQGALDAIYDTNGKITGITDDELVHYVKKFKSLEKIKLNTSAGYAIAGFMKEVEQNNLENGNHVILLNDGRSNLEIRQVTREEKIISNEKIVNLINDWLMEYSDDRKEIHEALENAFDKGLVLFAYHNNDLAGIGIVVNLGFETFATKYHLAYIATKKNIKGHGIATDILQKAVELAHGNLSLHVDLDNKRAMKLYKKMGFESHYFRMIYHSE